MKANYHVAAGDLRVIRPLAFVRERQTREFARTMQFPVIHENCPACFSQPKVCACVFCGRLHHREPRAFLFDIATMRAFQRAGLCFVSLHIRAFD
jgi:tRNA 2-thiocytidine biosynthesis protein TtcA